MASHTLYGKNLLCFTEPDDFKDIQGIGKDPIYKRYDSVYSVKFFGESGTKLSNDQLMLAGAAAEAEVTLGYAGLIITGSPISLVNSTASSTV